MRTPTLSLFLQGRLEITMENPSVGSNARTSDRNRVCSDQPPRICLRLMSLEQRGVGGDEQTG